MPRTEFAIAVFAFALACAGCRDSQEQPFVHAPATEMLAALESSEHLEHPKAAVNADQARAIQVRIERFCGDCHALPKPESFERDVWYDEVRKGYEFYARSGRADLDPPPVEEVVRYYRDKAPEEIEFPAFSPVDHDSQRRFRGDKIDWTDREYVLSGISSILWAPFEADGSYRLLVCDARDGSLNIVNPDPKQTSRDMLLRLQNPARVNRCDINDDGHEDFIIADLGSIYPFDHGFGKVGCLLRAADGKTFRPLLIAENLGRVADAAVGDLFGDSQPEIVVAEFGHRETGGLHVLHSISETSDTLSFESERLNVRPGTVRVILHDWDADGALDITTLLSQESESLEIYLNRDGKFVRYTVWSADDLTFGLVAMELVDLDQDADLDILFCNGDTFDNNLANRSHGVQWLENLGSLEFKYRRLVDLPGAYAAKAGDMDNDGDLDIVAVANLPEAVSPKSLRTSMPPSIVLLEQSAKKVFSARTISRDRPRYSSLELADFNSDGKLDFSVGALLLSPNDAVPRLTIWWQQ